VNFIPSLGHDANQNSVIQSKVSFLIQESRIPEIRWAFCDWSIVPMYIDDIEIKRVWLQGSSTPRKVIPVNGHWKEVVDFFGLLEANARLQGHMADAISNKSLALRSYRVYISNQRRDWSDRLNLWLSETISNYGSNLVRATAILIALSALLFNVIPVTSDDRIIYFCINQSSGQVLTKYIGYYLEFLSPVNASDFLDIRLSDLGIIIDNISRIIIGFIIYQVIRSTRKFVP
jgi:hypothetical protein